MNPTPCLPKGARVLVTGATGFTGSRLMRRLSQSGAAIRAIARPTSRVDSLEDVPILWFRGDVFEGGLIEEAARDVEYIFHLAAAYREARHSDAYYRRVHVESTRLLAEAAVKQSSFKRFVHVSTIGVHGHIEDPPADETYRFSPGDIYQVTKAEAETWFRDFAARNGLPHTVIRPAAIYGPGDTRLLKVFRMAARGWFPIFGRGKATYHLIHVDDLTAALILAAEHPAAEGEVFICGDAEPIPLAVMAATIAEAYGRRVRIVRLPVGPLVASAVVCETLCRALRIEPPLHRRRVAFYTKDRAFDTRKIRRLLGFSGAFTNRTGLTQTAHWYREKGWVR